MIDSTLPQDVPVIIDAIKAHESFPLVRCNYLSVECESPMPGWTIKLGGEVLPFMMLGLVGIITRPIGAEMFYNTNLIEDLFSKIEDEAGLLIEVDDIWLPMLLFHSVKTKPELGDVYRISSDMFAWALAFREGRIDHETFLIQCKQLERPLVFSEEETIIFKEWRELQIQNAIEQYPKNDNLKLTWHE